MNGINSRFLCDSRYLFVYESSFSLLPLNVDAWFVCLRLLYTLTEMYLVVFSLVLLCEQCIKPF